MWLPSQSVGIHFDAEFDSGYVAADDIYNWNHTWSGLNRCLTVGVSMLSVLGSSVVGITFNAAALTKIGHIASGSGAIRAELWRITGADAGAPGVGTYAVEVTLSAALDSAAGSLSFTGVHQTSPIEGQAGATGTSVGVDVAYSNIITTADNDWFVGVCASNDTSMPIVNSAEGRYNLTGALGSGAGAAWGPITPPNPGTASAWDISALTTWSAYSAGLRPVAAGSLSAAAGGTMMMLGV